MSEIRKRVLTAMSAAMAAVMITSCTPIVQSSNNPNQNRSTIALKTAAAPENAVNNTTTANTASPAANDSTPGQFAQEGLTIKDLVKQNINSVVTVAVTKVVNGGIMGNKYAKGVGSGFFIDSQGWIATNNHVIEDAKEVTIILNDGTTANGQVIWADPSLDLAVVQMDKSVKVPGVVSLGDSDQVEVGEQVVAIGNPMSEQFAGTVTNGIISAKNRVINIDGRDFHYLQTNAAINGGNSGGPLFDSKGKVIGINSAKITQMEIEGISFAIPVNTLINALSGNHNTQEQATNQTIIGININDVDQEAQKLAKNKYGLNLPLGVLITNVEKDSPAHKAGLLENDIIVEFDGVKISQGTELNALKSKHKAGDKVRVVIYRYSDNKYYETEITLAPRN